jgi:uncharacterized membrane protein
MLYKHDALYSEQVFSPILVIINIINIIVTMYAFHQHTVLSN